MQIAILVKQVPRVAELALESSGRLSRTGVSAEVDPLSRRALAKAIELVGEFGGTTTAIALGPPRAIDVLSGAIASGVNRGVLLTDPAFAGSDTLATARIISRAITQLGGFDLILMGRASIDGETGQLGPQLAELLGLPFIHSANALARRGSTILATEEHDFGHRDIVSPLPAVVACAERLCEPARIDPIRLDTIDPSLVTILGATELGLTPEHHRSGTFVGSIRSIERPRSKLRLVGSAEEIAERLVRELTRRGALDSLTASEWTADLRSSERMHPYSSTTPQEREGSPIVVLLDANTPSTTHLVTMAECLSASSGRPLIGVSTVSQAPTARYSHLVGLPGSALAERPCRSAQAPTHGTRAPPASRARHLGEPRDPGTTLRGTRRWADR